MRGGGNIHGRVRRFFRHLFTFASAASLVLCVAVGVLWVRSHWDQDELVQIRPGRVAVLQSSRGKIGLNVVTSPEFDKMGPRSQFSIYAPRDLVRQYAVPGSHTFGGFVVAWTPPDQWKRSHHNVLLPNWFVAGTALVPALLWIRAWRVPRRRREAGLCPACGYDLRASPDRCPECGAGASHAAAG